MKVYAAPENIKLSINYGSDDRITINAKVEAYKEAVKAWLTSIGYKGPKTGGIARFQVADGYAEYMLGDGKTSILIHLDMFDGYQYQHISYLPKKEILDAIKREEAMAALFAVHKKA